MPDALRIEGDARLAATLRHAADEIAEPDSAERAASARVAATARAGAPRRTGALAGSIRAQPSEGGADVIAAASYAGYVEYGVPSRHIPARPFMAAAAQDALPAVTGIYALDVRRAIATVKGA